MSTVMAASPGATDVHSLCKPDSKPNDLTWSWLDSDTVRIHRGLADLP